MTAYKKLEDNIFISGQLFADDLEKIKAQGFTTIICNRPDYEEDIVDQPLSNEIERQAQALGLQFFYIPMGSQGPTQKTVQETRHALDEARGPVLAYCLTGKRSVILCSQALALSGAHSMPDLVSAAQALGYNLSLNSELIAA